ncbi:hypothetical protein AGMMS50268_04100 [Spirochaetia bacterium]|nr:hypothetical protein AGMMS50268_04100 [Spirochaetia bacterium]
MNDTRAEVLKQILFRLDRLTEIGLIGQDGDILISVDEAAAIACLDGNTIREYGQKGKIPRYKMESNVRFGLREFCDWIASCRQPSLKEKKAAKAEA